MKNIKKHLAEMVWWKLPLSKIILEQGLFDEPAEDEGGDEGGDEEGGEEAEAEGDEAAEDAEAGEEGAEAEEEVAIEAGDEVRLGKQLDAQLDSMLLDFEANSLKSAAIADETYSEEEEQADVMVALEWWKRPLTKILVEQEEEVVVSEATLDIETFANDVFRLIQNYDVLLDMENAIFNKAMSFLQQKYGDEIAASFEEILRMRHGLDFSSQAVDMVDQIEAPMAQGAGGGGGDMGGA